MPSSALEGLSLHVDLSKKAKVLVPLHPPRSTVMLAEGNKLWPQVFHHSTSEERREGENDIDPDDWSGMEALSKVLWRDHGAAMVDPTTGEVVATSTAEAARKEPDGVDRVTLGSGPNPLASPILLAVQGVARIQVGVCG